MGQGLGQLKEAHHKSDKCFLLKNTFLSAVINFL